MSGRFLYLGSADSSSTGLDYPRGDGNPTAVSATTVTLGTAASTTASAFTGLVAFVYSGSGAGQYRLISAYSTDRVATLYRPWDQPYPNTASYLVYGVPMRHGDMAHYKVEYNTVTGTSGTLRSLVYVDACDNPRSVYSQTFQPQRIASTSGLSSTGDAQGETIIVDLMPLETIVAKVFIDSAPTAGTLELFCAAGKSHTRVA